MDPNQIVIVQVAGALGTVLGAWLLLSKIVVPFFKRANGWTHAWEQFMKDWSGEESRPGRDRIPGVMERLNEIDGQLKNNGGESVKDAVDRIEVHVNEIHDKVIQVDERLEKGDINFKKIEERLNKLEDNL